MIHSLTALFRRPPIGLWDLADILVVSILIYEVLKLIKGTRAVQMAVGAGFLALVFYGSRWIRLDTVNWLIRNFLGSIVFAIIVLFQADIRRALDGDDGADVLARQHARSHHQFFNRLFA